MRNTSHGAAGHDAPESSVTFAGIRISEVVQQTRFASGAELQATLNNYMLIYNHHIAQRALGHLSPVDALKSWRVKKPEIFLRRVYKHAELDT